MEPTTALKAGAIAKVTFDGFIKSGVGELAKKFVASAIDLINNLRNKSETKFRGSQRATIIALRVLC